MSIELTEYISYLNKENKIKYGEIQTPYELINKMLDMIPEDVFCNPNLKWLDPGTGQGYFTTLIYLRLFDKLKPIIQDDEERKLHIIKNMLYMIELNEDHIPYLKLMFSDNANIYNTNYITTTIFEKEHFDIIIGNPPYNTLGMKKVPTNNKSSKKNDGDTIWRDFVRKSLQLLKPDGYLVYIIPSIWMKPDREKIYNLLLTYDIQKLTCMTNTETNKMFNGEAQTPTCYFILKKTLSFNKIGLYDKQTKEYISFSLKQNQPIPLFGASILYKLQKFITQTGTIEVHKTNIPSKHTTIQSTPFNNNNFKNIKSCILKKNIPYLVFDYSNKPVAFYGKSKLILAHKMYGFPFYDISGEYGISTRDTYVITDRSHDDLIKLKAFLSTYFALYIFEATRYRMKYLEKYAFELLPDITKLSDFPKDINDNSIANYFGLSDIEQGFIKNLHKKKYIFEPIYNE